MTMKFGGVIVCQKFYQEIIKKVMTSSLFVTSSCILGSIWVKKWKYWNFFVFLPICLKFGIGGNFEMLITKRRPKLKSRNDLSKKLQFSTYFSPTYTKHSSTIALPWQQWMSHEMGLYSK